MSQQEFLSHISQVSREVESWPLWQQNFLIYSTQPTNPTPRLPVVIEGKSDSESEDRQTEK